MVGESGFCLHPGIPAFKLPSFLTPFYYKLSAMNYELKAMSFISHFRIQPFPTSAFRLPTSIFSHFPIPASHFT